MAKEPTPSITLRDPKTKKTADLSDEQGVRALLAVVIERIGANGAWQNRLPQDSTERVAAQILRKAGDVGRALGIVKNAETLHAILEGTDLEEDIAETPKPKRSEKQVGLIEDDALRKLCDDVNEALGLLWPVFRRSIEESEGEEKKKATISCEFVPETDDADAYIKVIAETKVTTQEITRTSKVRKIGGGKRPQLELFAG